MSARLKVDPTPSLGALEQNLLDKQSEFVVKRDNAAKVLSEAREAASAVDAAQRALDSRYHEMKLASPNDSHWARSRASGAGTAAVERQLSLVSA